jgi:hypothetical protein
VTVSNAINNLIPDIYKLLGEANKDIEFNTDALAGLGVRMVRHVRDEIKDPDRSDRDPSEVYVTQVTPNCYRKIWYNIFGTDNNVPKEQIDGSNKFKFLYGDLIEESVLFIAQVAGHHVEDEQRRLSVSLPGTTFTLSGRIDAMIDGVLVDVKSMENYSFQKWQSGEAAVEDKWGYMRQLYYYAGMMHMLGEPIDTVGILACNKQNGKLHLYTQKVDPQLCATWVDNMGKRISSPESLKTDPTRDVTSKGSNAILGPGCSYCPYKFDCYEEQGGLEVYAYSDGPAFICKPVGKPPKVPCITEAYIKERFKEK